MGSYNGSSMCIKAIHGTVLVRVVTSWQQLKDIACPGRPYPGRAALCTLWQLRASSGLPDCYGYTIGAAQGRSWLLRGTAYAIRLGQGRLCLGIHQAWIPVFAGCMGSAANRCFTARAPVSGAGARHERARIAQLPGAGMPRPRRFVARCFMASAGISPVHGVDIGRI